MIDVVRNGGFVVGAGGLGCGFVVRRAEDALEVEKLQLMEVGAGLGILRALLVALLGLAEVLVDVLPFLLAPLLVAVVAQARHPLADLLPQRALEPGLLEARLHVAAELDEGEDLGFGPALAVGVDGGVAVGVGVGGGDGDELVGDRRGVGSGGGSGGGGRVVGLGSVGGGDDRIDGGGHGGRGSGDLREGEGLARDLLQERHQSRVARRGQLLLLHSQLMLARHARHFLSPPRLVTRLPLLLAPLHEFQELLLHALLLLHQILHQRLEELRLRPARACATPLALLRVLSLLVVSCNARAALRLVIVVLRHRLRQGHLRAHLRLPLRPAIVILPSCHPP